MDPGPHLSAFVPDGAEGTVLIVAVTAVLAEIQPVAVFLASA